MVDGFVNYKLSRFKNKIEVAIKKARGDVVCDSEILNEDLLES